MAEDKTDELKLIEFLQLAGKLRDKPRRGFDVRGFRSSCDVASHTFRTALASMILADKQKLDVEKILRMALLHDLAESVIGDITPRDGVSKEKKLSLEKAVMRQILALLPEQQASYYLKLWEECAEEKSAEAKFLKQLDKLEFVLETLDYEVEFGYKMEFDDLYPWNHERISDTALLSLLKNFEKIRGELKANLAEVQDEKPAFQERA